MFCVKPAVWVLIEYAFEEKFYKGKGSCLLNSTPNTIVVWKDLMETIFEDWVHEMLASILTEFLLEYALKKINFCKFISSFSACMNSK